MSKGDDEDWGSSKEVKETSFIVLFLFRLGYEPIGSCHPQQWWVFLSSVFGLHVSHPWMYPELHSTNLPDIS